MDVTPLSAMEVVESVLVPPGKALISDDKILVPVGETERWLRDLRFMDEEKQVAI